MKTFKVIVSRTTVEVYRIQAETLEAAEQFCEDYDLDEKDLVSEDGHSYDYEIEEIEE